MMMMYARYDVWLLLWIMDDDGVVYHKHNGNHVCFCTRLSDPTATTHNSPGAIRRCEKTRYERWTIALYVAVVFFYLVRGFGARFVKWLLIRMFWACVCVCVCVCVYL